MNRYPVVDLLVARGPAIAIAVAALPLVAAIIAVAFGQPWWLLIVAIVVGAVLYLLMKSYVEVVTIIADMLLPK
jgi:hypothetical protein